MKRLSFALLGCSLQLIITATLLYQLHAQWNAPQPIPSQPAQHAPASAAEHTELFVFTLPRTEHNAVLARPLFTPNRRPVAFVHSLQADTPTELSGWRLTGIIAGGPVSIALFFNDEADSKALQPGMQLDGWTLTEIHSTTVTLTSGDQTLHLPLHQQQES